MTGSSREQPFKSLTPLRQETRSDVLARYVEHQLRDTGCSMETFAQCVVESYHAMVPEQRRSIKFKTGGDIFDCAKVNAKKLTRWTDRTTSARLPVEIEEAWVEALQQPYRNDCIRDLAARYGLLAARMPKATVDQDLVSLGQFTIEVGQALQSIAPILADHQIDEKDSPLAGVAINRLEDVTSMCTSLIERLRQLFGRHV